MEQDSLDFSNIVPMHLKQTYAKQGDMFCKIRAFRAVIVLLLRVSFKIFKPL